MAAAQIKEPLHGTFMIPILDEEAKNSDPWQRNYYQPPPFKFAPRTFPLIDLRPYISDPNYMPAGLLKSHGFGVVKHKSALFESPYAQEVFHNKQIIDDVYCPDMRHLVMKTTGAKHVFVTHCVIRRKNV